MQDTHPGLENARIQFPAVVETAEHKPSIRQAGNSAAWHHANVSLGIVDLITIRQLDYSLRIEGLLVKWQDDRISDDIVHEIDTARPRISQIADLNGCNATAEDFQAGICRISLQVNRDMNRNTLQEPGDALVGPCGDIKEA